MQRPSNQNLGDGLGRPRNKQVSAVDSVQAWIWEWPLSLEQALLSPEEEEASEVKQLKKIPKRREEQRKGVRSEGAVPRTRLHPRKGSGRSVPPQEGPGSAKQTSLSSSREQVIKFFTAHLPPKVRKLQG